MTEWEPIAVKREWVPEWVWHFLCALALHREVGAVIRTFHLQRLEDETGISGTGKVAEGVIFSNGWCAMTWLTANTSVAFYPDLKTVESIHGHNGKTLVVVDGESS